MFLWDLQDNEPTHENGFSQNGLSLGSMIIVHAHETHSGEKLTYDNYVLAEDCGFSGKPSV